MAKALRLLPGPSDLVLRHAHLALSTCRMDSVADGLDRIRLQANAIASSPSVHVLQSIFFCMI